MSSKIRKISQAKIRKLPGGRDPARNIEEFLLRRGFDPEECLHLRTNEISTWSVPLNEEEELELTLESLGRPAETTLYIGLNVCGVPLKGTADFLAAALTVADTLVGTKLSLVNYDLVISVTVYTENLSGESIDYYYELITRQKNSAYELIMEEAE